MSRRVAFYAPLKPPDDPTPSGDRRMARALIAALATAGFDVEIASRLRTYDRTGDRRRQERLAAIGDRCTRRVTTRLERRPVPDRPAVWLTYHSYHKSPDTLGPAVARALGIPYLLAEASFAPRRAGGPWAAGHAASERAIRSADLILAMTERDVPGLAPLVVPPAELRRLPPFLDVAPFAAAADARAGHRAALARRHGLDPERSWLLAVAMMRADVKLVSYRRLAEALRLIGDPRAGARPWQLVVVGDGPARAEVEAALAPLGPGGAVLLGALGDDGLPSVYAASDLFVWPAVREAYGLAMLEAAASGLPVVAGDEGGVREVVRHGNSGLLVPPGDREAFAAAVVRLLDDERERARLAAGARAFVASERSLARAADILHDATEAAGAIRARRSDSR